MPRRLSLPSRRMAVRECPPSAKKSSSTSIPERPSSSAISAATTVATPSVAGDVALGVPEVDDGVPAVPGAAAAVLALSDAWADAPVVSPSVCPSSAVGAAPVTRDDVTCSPMGVPPCSGVGRPSSATDPPCPAASCATVTVGSPATASRARASSAHNRCAVCSATRVGSCSTTTRNSFPGGTITLSG